MEACLYSGGLVFLCIHCFIRGVVFSWRLVCPTEACFLVLLFIAAFFLCGGLFYCTHTPGRGVFSCGRLVFPWRLAAMCWLGFLVLTEACAPFEGLGASFSCGGSSFPWPLGFLVEACFFFYEYSPLLHVCHILVASGCCG